MVKNLKTFSQLCCNSCFICWHLEVPLGAQGLKKELTFTLSRLETNYVSFSQVKFLVFEAQLVFSKLSEAAPWMSEIAFLLQVHLLCTIEHKILKPKAVFVKVSNPCWFIVSFKSRIYQASSKHFCKSSKARNLNCIAVCILPCSSNGSRSW